MGTTLVCTVNVLYSVLSTDNVPSLVSVVYIIIVIYVCVTVCPPPGYENLFT